MFSVENNPKDSFTRIEPADSGTKKTSAGKKSRLRGKICQILAREGVPTERRAVHAERSAGSWREREFSRKEKRSTRKDLPDPGARRSSAGKKSRPRGKICRILAREGVQPERKAIHVERSAELAVSDSGDLTYTRYIRGRVVFCRRGL